MSARSKKILVMIAMILILAVIVFIFFISRSRSNKLEEKLAMALEYSESMDYDKSVALYNEIMQNNSSEPEVYVGLSDVYVKMGKVEKAIAILERGLENAGQNKKIMERLNDLTGGDNEYGVAEADETSDDGLTEVSEGGEESGEDTEVTTAVTTVPNEDPEDETTVTSVPASKSAVTEIVTVTVPGETVYVPVYVTVPGTTAATTTTHASSSTTTAPPVTSAAKKETEVNTSLSGTSKERSININNLSDYILTKDYVEALGIYENTLIKIKSYYVTLYLNSSVFKKCDEIDLSLSVNNNTGRSVVNFKNESDFGCEVKVVITSNSIISNKLAGAHLYRNSTDLGTVAVNSDGYPEFTITRGGKYTVLPYEEEEKVSVAVDDGTKTISVNNLNDYVLTKKDIQALGIGSNKIIKLKSYYATLYFNSSIFDKNSSIDLSMSFTNTTGRAVINVKSDSDFGGSVKLELTSCTMSAKKLADAHWYKDGVDKGAVKINDNGYPEITITGGGKYTIE